tara:strand:+ start:267 stop:1067 length:801 start_codon:yes stop_codon:yes gene_type:complete
MHTFVLLVVSLTSLASLVLSAMTLEDHPNKEEYVITNIVGISILFVAMGLRGFLPSNPFVSSYSLEWLSILASGVALGAISVAYGANINNDDLNVLLGLSVLSLALSALLGHFMKYKKEEPKEEPKEKSDAWLFRLIRLLFIFTAAILHIVNLVDENKVYKKLHAVVGFSFLVFSFSVLWFYIGHFQVFFDDENLKHSELRIGSFIDFGNAHDIIKSNSTKLLNIVSSAVLLSTYGIFYGHTTNDIDLASGILILLVIVIDHYLKK